MQRTHLPETGFLRLSQILEFFPVGKSSWWAGVAQGRYPKPVKLGPRTTAWRVEDIRELIQNHAEAN
jgi:prophage regulatory protein